MARSLSQSLTATTQKLKGKKNGGKGKNKPSAKIKKTQKRDANMDTERKEA